MYNRINYLLLVVFILVLPFLANAQPGFGDDINDVPIDGGLSVLLAAGVGYAYKKMKSKQPNQK